MKKNPSKNRKLLKHLGLNIKFYRKKLNLTQEKLAEILDAERSYITALESGNKSPSLYFLQELSEALNVKLKDLTDIKIN